MTSLTFRSSKVVYYGPHPCENCGVSICKAGNDFGGSAFTYPSLPIYPNTEWHAHFCNPADVRDKAGAAARKELLVEYPHAVPVRWHSGFVILADPDGDVVLSSNMTMYDTILAAWLGAKERKDNDWPMWSLKDERILPAHFTAGPPSRFEDRY